MAKLLALGGNLHLFPPRLTNYRRGLTRSAHSLQSGFPPVPCRRFSFSMLLPVLQSVLLWWTFCLMECHELTTATVPPLLRLDKNSNVFFTKSRQLSINKTAGANPAAFRLINRTWPQNDNDRNDDQDAHEFAHEIPHYPVSHLRTHLHRNGLQPGTTRHQ